MFIKSVAIQLYLDLETFKIFCKFLVREIVLYRVSQPHDFPIQDVSLFLRCNFLNKVLCYVDGM